MKNILLLILSIMLLIASGCCQNTWSNTVESCHVVADDKAGIPVFKGTYDTIAFKAHEWVYKNITYVSDKGEYWQNDLETITRMKGDCEDGAILIYSIMIRSGVPKNRIKVIGGKVFPDNKPAGYHAWCVYKRSDGVWITLDWCFYSNHQQPILLRKPLTDDQRYGKTIKYFIEG